MPEPREIDRIRENQSESDKKDADQSHRPASQIELDDALHDQQADHGPDQDDGQENPSGMIFKEKSDIAVIGKADKRHEADRDA
jgi:hypothetical protein